MIDRILFLLAGLIAIYFGGRWFVDGASKVAIHFGIRPFIVGLTVVAFGTSAPEFFMGLIAGIEGASTVSLGNIIGSNVANATYVIGVCALLAPILTSFGAIKKEGFFVISTVGLALLLALDGFLGIIDGLILLSVFVVYIVAMIRSLKLARPSAAVASEFKNLARPPRGMLWSIGVLVFGLVMLIVGAQVSINSAVEIARGFGISEFIIGFTLITLGTTLPELTVSAVAALRKEVDIAIGNSLGSIIFNSLVVLSLGSIIQGVEVPPSILITGFLPCMFFAGLILWLVFRKGGLRKVHGALLIVLYVIYLIVTLLVA